MTTYYGFSTYPESIIKSFVEKGHKVTIYRTYDINSQMEYKLVIYDKDEGEENKNE